MQGRQREQTWWRGKLPHTAPRKSNDNERTSMRIYSWKRVSVTGLWLCLALCLNAQELLNSAQQRRAAHLYTEFVAPCCWRQSVAIHQSEAARKVRSEIDSKILSGDSDSQIKTALVKEYGHGILMEPEGIRALLAYSLPFGAFVLGLIAVIQWISRHRQQNSESKKVDVVAGNWPDLEFEQ
jgi:cytochrome c-type biogenesis protein CcmH/NrfF